MTLHVIYENSAPVSQRVQALIGIQNFGRLIFRRRTLLAWLQDAAKSAGLEPPIELNSAAARGELETRLRNGEWSQDRFLICPSRIVSSRGFEALTLFLRQAVYSPGNMALPVSSGPDWAGWALLSAPLLRDYLRKQAEGDLPGFFEQHGQEIVRLGDRLALIDLDDEATLLNFLSGAFDVRFFNSITQDEYTITKRSTDTGKLEREYRFFELIPPLMQMFFVRPFGFQRDAEFASYRMERLHVPDMALQWLHGAFTAAEFGRFLDRVFHFVSIRARRSAGRMEAEQHAEMLYIQKVEERLRRLKTLSEYELLKPLLKAVCGDLDALAARYCDLMRANKARFPNDHLVIGHGDLCFSNILYGKASQAMKLIDPRGASGEEDLYTHPYYDVAKLSHSVLGSYDFINQDMFDVQVDEEMKLRLVLDRSPPEWAAAMFEQRLEQAGFDLTLVRLCEASLFISMLPLHIDRPRKVLGFAINAVNILDAVEAAH